MCTTLLIDDQPLTTKALRKVIEQNFTDIEILAETTNGLKAWDLILKKIPDFIISDIRMPNLNGLELMEKIRKAGLHTRIILLTAYGEFEYAQKAIQLGASGYLLKPFSQTELIKEIRQIKLLIEEENVIHSYKSKVSKLIPLIEENAFKKIIAGKMDMVQLNEFINVVGDQWRHCFVCVYQIGSAHSKITEIEEVVKISIIEEINKHMAESGLHGISFFRKFNEIVMAFNHPDKKPTLVELKSSLAYDCAQIIGIYLHEGLKVGISNQDYLLQNLPLAYENAIAHMVHMDQDQNISGSFPTSSDQQDFLINKVIDYCKQNYAKDISLQKAADQININKYSFCKLFKDKLEITFWDYITQLRISQAKELLLATNKNVNDIALKIGYINSSHFGRIFKEIVGKTPVEYRKQLKMQIETTIGTML